HSRIVFCALAIAGLAIGAVRGIASSGNGPGTSGPAKHSRASVRTLRADEVTGEVTLTQSGSDAAPDASQVVVWLTPSGSTPAPTVASDKPRYRLPPTPHN